MPSWPLLFKPQHLTPPPLTSAQLCLPPKAMTGAPAWWGIEGGDGDYNHIVIMPWSIEATNQRGRAEVEKQLALGACHKWGPATKQATIRSMPSHMARHHPVCADSQAAE